MPRDYKVRNVVESVLNEVWALQPEKLDAILSFLEARVAGELPSEDQVQAALGSRREAEDDGPVIINGVQVIDVAGTLAPRMNLMQRFSGGTSTMQLAKDIREAQANDQVKSILLFVDSPGGAASYTQEVATLIRSSEKRIVAAATNVMASGAYWIGAAAHEVYASPSTEVGSIGVYSILPNSKEYYEKQGIKFTVLRAGSVKAAGNPYEDLTPERLGALRDRVNAVYGSFLSAVAEYRRTSITQVEKSFGQGTVFLADEAANRGMIDGVLTFEEVLAREQQRVVSAIQPASKPPFRIEERVMDPRLKAALFARGLVASLDASDDVFEAAAHAYATASGVAREELLATFTQTVVKNQGTITATPTQNTGQPVPNEQHTTTTSDRSVIAAERERVLELQSRGQVLGIAADDIQTAIENGIDVASAVDGWTKRLAATHRPITPVPGEGEHDKLVAGASAVIQQRLGHILGQDEETERNARQYGSSFQYARTTDILRSHLNAAGFARVPNDPREIARTFLENELMVSDGSVNSRGAHPTLLSSIVAKSLTQGANLAPVTYPMWCSRIEDLPDFKPKSFIDVGIFNRLDAIQEKEALKELSFSSQLSHWIIANSYANKVGLSVEMIVDDDMGGFARQLVSLGTASRMTINTTVIELLVVNPTMPDGIAFFHTSHSNVVTGGDAGVPSTTTMNKHRLKHRLLQSFGSEYPSGAPIDKILAPATLEENVLQTVAPFATIGEQKVPITDATLNTYRGKVTPVIDAYLDAHSTSAWYTAIPTALGQPMVYAFQSGFGESGRRDEWYDPEKRTRWVSNETRFGVAMANWRAMVRNA